MRNKTLPFVSFCTARDGQPDFGGAAIGFEKFGSDLSDRKSTRLNSSHRTISYAVFCLKKKNTRGLNDAAQGRTRDLRGKVIPYGRHYGRTFVPCAAGVCGVRAVVRARRLSLQRRYVGY